MLNLWRSCSTCWETKGVKAKVHEVTGLQRWGMGVVSLGYRASWIIHPRNKQHRPYLKPCIHTLGEAEALGLWRQECTICLRKVQDCPGACMWCIEAWLRVGLSGLSAQLSWGDNFCRKNGEEILSNQSKLWTMVNHDEPQEKICDKNTDLRVNVRLNISSLVDLWLIWTSRPSWWLFVYSSMIFQRTTKVQSWRFNHAFQNGCIGEFNELLLQSCFFKFSKWYCWWFRNPADQLSLVVYPMDFSHQQ